MAVRSKQIPSLDEFLVRVPSGTKGAAAKRLAAFGQVEEAGEAGGFLVRLRGASRDGAKTVWEKLQKSAGRAQVDPVLLDETGAPHFPTGEVTIRFKQPPTDAFLEDFAERFGLEVRSRNEYVPAQIAFRVAARGYLPELIESMATADNVAGVWANTKSRYQRT